MTTYGLTLRDVRRIALITGILGLLLLAIEFGVGHVHGTLSAHLGLVFGVPAGIAFGPPLLIGTCGLTDIAVVDDEVQLRLGRRVLARRPVADLTGISLRGRSAAVVLRFKDGSRMRLLAIPVPRRRALCEALLARAPDRSHISIRA